MSDRRFTAHDRRPVMFAALVATVAKRLTYWHEPNRVPRRLCGVIEHRVECRANRPRCQPVADSSQVATTRESRTCHSARIRVTPLVNPLTLTPQTCSAA